MPVSQQRYHAARPERPVNPRVMLALAAIAVVLLAIIIVRFIAFGGTAAEYGAVKSQIDEQRAQIAQLETSSTELQGQIDSMQPVIEQYNASGKK